MIKTAVILAEGFEEVEALTAVDLLRRAGIGCRMTALADSSTVTGSHGICVKADGGFSDTELAELDGLILPGGMPGTKNLLADARLPGVLRAFALEGKLLAAICAAPSVLAQAGLLEGRRAVCYPDWEDRMDGALLCSAPAVTDENIITGRGLGAAVPFALEIVRYFQGDKKADSLAGAVVWR